MCAQIVVVVVERGMPAAGIWSRDAGDVVETRVQGRRGIQVSRPCRVGTGVVGPEGIGEGAGESRFERVIVAALK